MTGMAFGVTARIPLWWFPSNMYEFSQAYHESDIHSQGKGPLTAQRYTFAPRMAKTPKSFIREILKVTERPEVISFAGGLPSPALIDVEGIRVACA